jgi:hypothetical protein
VVTAAFHLSPAQPADPQASCRRIDPGGKVFTVRAIEYKFKKTDAGSVKFA